MPSRRTCHDGTSLIEAVIASGLLALVLVALLPLTTAAIAGTHAGRTDGRAASLARHRLAQLRGLTHMRTASTAIVDLTTRVDHAEPAVGGPGLSPTGVAPLEYPTEGWSDWLDEQGRWVGAGPSPPAGARYGRQWGVLSGETSACVRLWVSVQPLHEPASRRAHAAGLQCAWGVAHP